MSANLTSLTNSSATAAALPFAAEASSLLFVAVILFCGSVFERVFRTSPLLGQIVAGLLLGPSLWNVVPHPTAVALLGKLGVMLLVVESGLSVDHRQMRRVGLRGFLAAASGVVLPVAGTLLLLMLGWNVAFKSALAAGAAIAPTSLGFSATLLGTDITTALGQMICAAAVVDDVLSLLLLAEVKAMRATDATAWTFVQPVVGSFGSIAVGIILAAVLPMLVQGAKRRLARCTCCVGKRKGKGKGKGKGKDAGEDGDDDQPATTPATSPREEVGMLVLLAILVVGLGFACALVGSSDLLGCFVAGFALASFDAAKTGFETYFGTLTRVGSALFFAATVAFTVPSFLSETGGLFEPEALAIGAVLTVVAIVGKLAIGCFVSPLTWDRAMAFGWAMNGRGEFSFLIAAEALKEGVLTPAVFSGAVWGALLSSAVAPFGFRYYLQMTKKSRASCPCCGGLGTDRSSSSSSSSSSRTAEGTGQEQQQGESRGNGGDAEEGGGAMIPAPRSAGNDAEAAVEIELKVR